MKSVGLKSKQNQAGITFRRKTMTKKNGNGRKKGKVLDLSEGVIRAGFPTNKRNNRFSARQSSIYLGKGARCLERSGGARWRPGQGDRYV